VRMVGRLRNAIMGNMAKTSPPQQERVVREFKRDRPKGDTLRKEAWGGCQSLEHFNPAAPRI